MRQGLQILFVLCLVFGSMFLFQSREGDGFYTRLYAWTLFGIGSAGCAIYTVFGLWVPMTNTQGPGLSKCPECGAGLPPVRIPKSRREMLWGGVTCPKCGVELDRHGNKVERPPDDGATSD